MLDDALAWILSLALLGSMALLASMALRAGESAGHQSIRRPMRPAPAEDAGAAEGEAAVAEGEVVAGPRRLWAVLRQLRRGMRRSR